MRALCPGWPQCLKRTAEKSAERIAERIAERKKIHQSYTNCREKNSVRVAWQASARHEHLTVLKLNSPSKSALIESELILAWSTVNFAAGTHLGR